jgi:hypothetical protein
MLTIGFEADPEVVRAYVPEPLELDGSGLCYLRVYDAVIYNDRQLTEFISPERVEYAEAFFWIPCQWQGETYYFMPYSWCDSDTVSYLGRTAGVPHKMAKVLMTRFHPSDPVYNGPKEGVRVCFSAECVGLVLRGSLAFRREVAHDSDELPIAIRHPQPRYLGRRSIYDVVGDGMLVDDLVAHWGDDRVVGPIWTGDADLQFYEAEGEEVLPFQPRRIVGAWWYTLLFNHKKGLPVVLTELG